MIVKWIKTNSRYCHRRQISGEIYILIIMADCVIGEQSCARAGWKREREREKRGRGIKRAKRRRVGWRRQDATEVWYFAEKSSHCLKVDGVTPRRKITSGAASINSLLPPFAQPPLSAKWRKLVFNYSCTRPPPSPTTRCLPLRFVSRSFLHGLPRCRHPVHLHPFPLSSDISPATPNLFLRHSICRAEFWWTTSLWNYTTDKAEFICIREKHI